MNLGAGREVAVREAGMAAGHGFADYVLFIDGQAAGVLAANPAGYPLTGVELQADKYATGLPATLDPPVTPRPVVYNAAYPPEYFDVIVIDECHRSICTFWRQVLEYFDAFLIGLTATPARQTFGIFKGTRRPRDTRHELQAVTPDASAKTHFVIVDCAGLSDTRLADTQPLEAKALVTSFEQFIEEHKDEIDALQCLYAQPYATRLRYTDLTALAA